MTTPDVASIAIPPSGAAPSDAPASVRGTPPSAQRVPALDAIRGLAILVVVVHNARFAPPPGGPLALRLYAAAASAGWIGVQLFFALSGFLITGILLDTRGGRGWIRRFYARRVLRIFPLYYAALAATTLVALAFARAHHAVQRGGIGLAWYWSYLANWRMPWRGGVPWLGHFWSLAVEEQFYLAWPLVVLAARGRRLAVLCVAVAVAALALRVALVSGALLSGRAGLGAAYFWTVARLDPLLFGALGAVALRAMSADSLRSAARLALAMAGGALLLLVAVHRLPPIDALSLAPGQWFVALAAGAWVTLSALPHDGPLGRRRWLRVLGKYSYAIYVLHVPIVLATAPIVARSIAPLPTLPRLAAQIAYALTVLAASLAGALVTWHAIEQPFLRLKAKVPRESASR